MPHSHRPTRQPPGVIHLTIGDILVTAVNDGTLGGAALNFLDFVTNITKDEAAAAQREAFRSVPPWLTVNTYVLHLPDRLVLVDGGCGPLMFGPAAGLLTANL